MNAPAQQPTITVGGFSIDILVQGFPGKTVCHGGLGWSTVALVRGQGRVVLIDAGNFGMRRVIAERMHASLQTMAQLTVTTEADATALVTNTSDRYEGVKSLMENRPPEFTGN